MLPLSLEFPLFLGLGGKERPSRIPPPEDNIYRGLGSSSPKAPPSIRSSHLLLGLEQSPPPCSPPQEGRPYPVHQWFWSEPIAGHCGHKLQKRSDSGLPSPEAAHRQDTSKQRENVVETGVPLGKGAPQGEYAYPSMPSQIKRELP